VKERIKKHIAYHGVLIAVMLLGLFLLVATAYDPRLQTAVVVMTTFFYVVWALLHHYRQHDLTPQIVIEYVLIGILGITVVFLLIQ
jgi:hypothetical protein